ncbi:MAG: P-loop NTPase, partial [Chromatiales bacterium]|nr:P-loop NTPase [Chromatiales bacterium]
MNAKTPLAPRDGGRTSKVIAITSGKGGVGKTNVSSNLAVALAKQGSRVCIFDADTSLANINVIMGVTPRYTIEHLLNGEHSIEEILLEGPAGVMIVPAASGIADLATLDANARERLLGALSTLETSFDYLLIDTAAGIGESVLCFVHSAQHTILVISTEPTSLTDAFALLRVLKRQEYQRPAYVLVNMALNYANSMEVYKRFEAAVRKYLSMKVHYLGYITDDKVLKASIRQQRPVLLNDPDALASRCFTTLAAVLSKQLNGQIPDHSFSAYWSELAGNIAAPVTPIAPATPSSHPSPAAPATAAHETVAEPARESDSSTVPARAGQLLPPTPEEGTPENAEAPSEASEDSLEKTLLGNTPGNTLSEVSAEAPADDLDTLTADLGKLLVSPGADAETLGRFLGTVFGHYVTRFRRLPLTIEVLADLVGETVYGDDEIRVLITALKEKLER